MQYVDLIWIHIQINPVVKQTNKKTLHVLYNTKCSNTVWIFDDIRDTTFFCVCVGGGDNNSDNLCFKKEFLSFWDVSEIFMNEII